jgi:hypothetical protein
MDANPDCKLCGGTGRITPVQAGIIDADDVRPDMFLMPVMCFRCSLGLDEREPEVEWTPLPPPGDGYRAAMRGLDPWVYRVAGRTGDTWYAQVEYGDWMCTAEYATEAEAKAAAVAWARKLSGSRG